ncbi:hypothetical protein [Kitasatospora aureofaciens]|uniref:hypothetical protein n=1 Tax=Kitasatospora aureofaciens TaxID=1894 RepID=UPI0005264981|nr:hypothetical protein [Kitasatospora aureofaciens]
MPTHALTPHNPLTRYTMTPLLNIATSAHGWPDHHFGYRPGHTLVRAADPDTLFRPLTFTLEAADLHEAVTRARSIGRRLTTDLHRNAWPLRLRHLVTGDVITLTREATPREPHHYALGPYSTATALPGITEPLPLALVIQNPAIRACLIDSRVLTAHQAA